MEDLTKIFVTPVMSGIWIAGVISVLFNPEQHGPFFKWLLVIYALDELKGDFWAQFGIALLTVYYICLTNQTMFGASTYGGIILSLLFVVGVFWLLGRIIAAKTDFKSNWQSLYFALTLIASIYIGIDGQWYGFAKPYSIVDWVTLLIAVLGFSIYVLNLKNKNKTNPVFLPKP